MKKNEGIIYYTKKVDQIWHAGDIGSIEVIDILKRYAPTKAVWENIDDFQTTIQVEEPSVDATIIIPNNNGTMITTGNDNLIDAVGTIVDGVWQANIIQDDYISDSLTLNNGTINGTAIGSIDPDSARVTHLRSVNGISLGDGSVDLSPDEITHCNTNLKT